MKSVSIDTTINGKAFRFEAAARLLLVDLIRDKAGLTGTHVACDTGNCGACTILFNGMSVKSCQLLAARADGAAIVTVEGIKVDGERLDPIQEAFWDCDAAECGFCTAGMLMTAVAFLEENSDPTEQDIRNAFKGNLCRCTGYLGIIKAVQRAAELRRNGRVSPGAGVAP
jgi:aerobic-type carbon monoxide dehydrogenase small subunit (CoxS/CutS family)